MKNLCECVYGSHSTNTASTKSDKDKIIFVAPSFEDLFNKRDIYIKEEKIDKDDLLIDIKYWDIRTLSHLAIKPNIYNLAILFSHEVKYFNMEDKTQDIIIKRLLDEIFSLRHDIAESNLPYVFDSCLNIARQKTRLYEKNNEDVKSAARAYQCLDFILRYARFQDAALALRYDDSDLSRNIIIQIKEGLISDKNIKAMLNRLNELASSQERIFNQPRNTNVLNELDDLLKALIRQVM